MAGRVTYFKGSEALQILHVGKTGLWKLIAQAGLQLRGRHIRLTPEEMNKLLEIRAKNFSNSA